jgi:hypothetical protein
MPALNVERRRRLLGFEAGLHRRSAIQARTKKKITHETGIFFYAICQSAYNRFDIAFPQIQHAPIIGAAWPWSHKQTVKLW